MDHSLNFRRRASLQLRYGCWPAFSLSLVDSIDFLHFKFPSFHTTIYLGLHNFPIFLSLSSAVLIGKLRNPFITNITRNKLRVCSLESVLICERIFHRVESELPLKGTNAVSLNDIDNFPVERVCWAEMG